MVYICTANVTVIDTVNDTVNVSFFASERDSENYAEYNAIKQNVDKMWIKCG